MKLVYKTLALLFVLCAITFFAGCTLNFEASIDDEGFKGSGSATVGPTD